MKIARYLLPLLTGSLLSDYSYAETCGKLRTDIACLQSTTPYPDLKYKFDIGHQVDSCGNETAIYGFEVCNNSSSVVTFNGTGFKIRGTKITNGWPRKSNMMSNTCYKHRVRIEAIPFVVLSHGPWFGFVGQEFMINCVKSIDLSFIK